MIIDLLNNYVLDPENPDNNYLLGAHYESIGQTAAALSFFLRASERTKNNNQAYECLIRMGNCFNLQENRKFSVKSMYEAAITLIPERPEGYYYLSRFLERDRQFFESYMICEIGLNISKYKNFPSLNVYYPGRYGLIFQKAVAAWWRGKGKESRQIFQYLVDKHWNELDKDHLTAVINNVRNLGCSPESYIYRMYKKSMYSKLRHKFAGAERLRENYSQIYQDLFVLSMFNGKRNGSFLEVGGAGPKKGNNTYLLEREFGWNGISIEFDKNFVEEYKKVRPTEIICQDALTIDYEKLILEKFGNTVDYLQLDIEPADNTYECLLRMPFDKVKFAVITYEHDYYADFTRSFRQKSRDYLISKGYVMVANDLSPDGVNTFEDWWVHPDLVSEELITKMRDVSEGAKDATEYMFSGSPNDGPKKTYTLIDNTAPKAKKYIKDKWKYSISPTLEFTTIVPEKGCIVDCVFCPQRTLVASYKGERRLTLENFKKAVDKLPKEVRVTFSGFVEPWMNSDCTEMVLYAHETGHPVSVFTTLVGMSPEDLDRIKHIPFAGAPNGGFVVHLPDQELRAKHPITKKYIKTAEHLAKIKNEIQNFSVMSMGTVHEKVVHLFPDATVHKGAMYSRAGNLIGERLLKPELKDQNFLTVDHGDRKMTCGCDERLYHNVMLPNGDVSLCCMDYGIEEITGNLFESDYNDVIPDPYEVFKLCNKCENAVAVDGTLVISEKRSYGLDTE